jgi:hypothetical protein
MPLVMKKDVALDPVDVGLLSPQTVMFHPNDFADLIKEFGRVRDFATKSGLIPRFCG